MVCSETIRSGSGNGNARNNTPLTTLKIAVVAPIPSASVSTTITLNLKFVLNCLAQKQNPDPYQPHITDIAANTRAVQYQ